jgi:8-oxo-dGTP diphosphatase
VPVYLLRHAHAGNRAQWQGSDAARPLSAKGDAQAEALADLLGDKAIHRVVSSPTERCTRTVAPLADRLGLAVRTRKVLAADADPADAITYLLRQAAQNPVLCTHGELMPKIIRRLRESGMKGHDANIAQKAAGWVLDVEDGSVVRGRYLPPPDLDT